MPRLIARATLALFLLVTGALAAEDPSAPAAPSAEPANTATPNLPALTLDECVAQALEKNFNVRIQKFSTEQAKDSVIIAQSGYDPAFSLSSEKSVTQDAARTNPSTGAIAGGLYTNNETTLLSVSQKIITGGTISANSDLERNRDVPAS